jgi:hypothetical protein
MRLRSAVFVVEFATALDSISLAVDATALDDATADTKLSAEDGSCSPLPSSSGITPAAPWEGLETTALEYERSSWIILIDTDCSNKWTTCCAHEQAGCVNCANN